MAGIFKKLDKNKNGTVALTEMEEIFQPDDAQYFYDNIAGESGDADGEIGFKEWRSFFAWSLKEGVGEKRLGEAERQAQVLYGETT